jgi:hypothetical protein
MDPPPSSFLFKKFCGKQTLKGGDQRYDEAARAPSGSSSAGITAAAAAVGVHVHYTVG